MKVISEDVLGVDIRGQRDDDGKGRTDVQDILAENDNESSCRSNGPTVAVSSGISPVLPGLMLCGAGVCRPADLRSCGVTCIVSAAHELPDTPLPHPDTVFLRIPVLDTVDDDLTPYFDMVADVIEQVKISGGCTLVHCVAGVSRSASLCLAYLMREQRISLSDAFRFLRSKRPQIRPNTGFFKQLIKYEEQLFGKASVSIVFNEAAGKDIPDVYEPDYREMVWYRQQYCITGRY